jgi:hypothetical protein
LSGVPVNLMTQYRPDHLVLRGHRPELRLATSPREIQASKDLAASLGVSVLDDERP